MPHNAEKGFRELDFRVGVAVGLAVALYLALTSLIDGAGNYVNVCVLAICTGFLTDMGPGATWKNGLTRLTVTGIGAIVALIPVTFYNLVKSDILLIPVVMICAVIAIVLIKATNVMFVQCRIGLVAYVLTVYTFHDSYYASIGKTCYQYCICWIVSTVLGIAVSVVTVTVWEAVKKLIVKSPEKV